MSFTLFHQSLDCICFGCSGLPEKKNPTFWAFPLPFDLVPQGPVFQDMAGFEVTLTLIDKLPETVSNPWPVIDVLRDSLDLMLSDNESVHHAVHRNTQIVLA